MSRINWRPGKRPGEKFAQLNAVGGPTIMRADGSCFALATRRNFPSEEALVAAIDSAKAAAEAAYKAEHQAKVERCLDFGEGIRSILHRKMEIGPFLVEIGHLDVHTDRDGRVFIKVPSISIEGHSIARNGMENEVGMAPRRLTGSSFEEGVKVGEELLSLLIEGTELDKESLSTQTIPRGPDSSVTVVTRKVTLLSGERVEREKRTHNDWSPHTKYDECEGTGAW